MQRMLSTRDLQPQDLQGLSPETVTALAAQMLGHIAQQARELEFKQKLIERKDRDIAWRDAKIEKITFELTRLKRWKFGAKSEAMDAQQRQMFQDTLLEDEAIWRRNWPRCEPLCPRRRPRPRHLADARVARHCLIIFAASNTTTSPRTRPARQQAVASR